MFQINILVQQIKSTILERLHLVTSKTDASEKSEDAEGMAAVRQR